MVVRGWAGGMMWWQCTCWRWQLYLIVPSRYVSFIVCQLHLHKSVLKKASGTWVCAPYLRRGQFHLHLHSLFVAVLLVLSYNCVELQHPALTLRLPRSLSEQVSLFFPGVPHSKRGWAGSVSEKQAGAWQARAKHTIWWADGVLHNIMRKTFCERKGFNHS